MKNRVVIDVLRLLLLVALGLILAVQVVVLPLLSGEMARSLPDEAHMRWPMLILAVLGLACVQVAIVGTLRLLRLTREDRVFTPAALTWVDLIIGAFVAGGVICLATLTYQSFTVAGPFLWMLALWCGVLAAAGLALLMWTMRTLLVQATALRTDMEMVI